VPAAAVAALRKVKLPSRGRIAVAVGSRGISGLAEITRTVLDTLRGQGAQPFIVPAMGSHGGATAAGQKTVLASLGITAESMGVKIDPSMDVVEMVRLDRVPLYVAKCVAEADGVVVINRIKPHTVFTGSVESGLVKMLTLGLGKHQGAQTYHRAFLTFSFDELLIRACEELRRFLPICFGVAILEDALGHVAAVEAVPPGRLVPRERELLEASRELMPRLPCDDLDVLVIDELGKEISGSGMDSNVIGRRKPGPTIKRIVVRDLSEASHGNALGLGIADFVTRRLVDKMDPEKTYVNALTSLSLEAVKIPITLATDREAIETALTTIGLTPPEQARILWVKDTLHLTELWASEALADECAENPEVDVLGPPQPIRFDSDGAATAWPE